MGKEKLNNDIPMLMNVTVGNGSTSWFALGLVPSIAISSLFFLIRPSMLQNQKLFQNSRINMLRSDIEIVYHLQKEIDDTPPSNRLIESFTWLEKLILFMPMWSSKKPNNVTRSKFVSMMMTILTICYTIFYFIYLMRIDLKYTPQIISTVIKVIASAFMNTARILDIYYYYFRFDFPWYNEPLSNNSIDYSKNAARTYNIMIILSVTVCIVSDLIGLTGQFVTSSYLEGWTPESLRILIIIAVGRVMVIYPLFISECVAGVIFLKYAMCLDYLSECIRSKSRGIKEIFTDYCTLYEQFRAEYCFSIRWQIHFTLLGILVYLWLLTYFLLLPRDFWGYFETILLLVADVCIFLLFLVPASLVSASFHGLEDSLWIHSKSCMIEQDDKDMTVYYNYFIQYALRHPIQVKVGNFTVSRKSIVRFIMIFAAAKAISYSIGYFVY